MWRLVIVRLFIRTSIALNDSPAYLFTTGSAPVSSDSGTSWKNYILLYLNNSFIFYALRLTRMLLLAFTLWFPLQTDSQLLFPLIFHNLLDDFVVGSPYITTHLSHNILFTAGLDLTWPYFSHLCTDSQHRLRYCGIFHYRIWLTICQTYIHII